MGKPTIKSPGPILIQVRVECKGEGAWLGRGNGVDWSTVVVFAHCAEKS